MSSLIDRPLSARHRAGKIQVEMESGLEIAFPVQGNPRLEGKPPEQLDHIELYCSTDSGSSSSRPAAASPKTFGAPGSTLSIGSAMAFA